MGLAFSQGFSYSGEGWEGVVAWLALVGFFLIWSWMGCAKRSAMASLAFSLGWFVPGLNWVMHSMTVYGNVPWVLSALAVVLLGATLSLVTLIPVPLSAWVRKRSEWGAISATVGLMVFLEWVRLTWFPGFGWLSPAYAVVDTPLLASAAVGGTVLMNALTIAGAAWTAMSLRALFNPAFSKKGWVLWLLWAITVVGLNEAWKAHPYPVQDKSVSPLYVRAVQPDLPLIHYAYQPEDADRFEALLPFARAPWPKGSVNRLFITPEGLVGRPVNHFRVKEQDVLVRLQREAQAPILFNGFRVEGTRVFNTGFLWDNGIRYTLDKRNLVPFGEFVPPGARWVVDALGIPMHDLTEGEGLQPALKLDGLSLGLLICYENLYGETVREMIAADKPDLFVVTSNMKWFGEAARAQQLQMARVRAVEAGRPVLSVSNDGPTAWVNSRGEVIQELSTRRQGELTLAVPKITVTENLYQRWGDRPGLVFLLLLLLGSVFTRFYPRPNGARGL